MTTLEERAIAKRKARTTTREGGDDAERAEKANTLHFDRKKKFEKEWRNKTVKPRTLKISSDNRGIQEQYGEILGLLTGDVFDKASLLLYVIEQ